MGEKGSRAFEGRLRIQLERSCELLDERKSNGVQMKEKFTWKRSNRKGCCSISPRFRKWLTHFCREIIFSFRASSFHPSCRREGCTNTHGTRSPKRRQGRWGWTNGEKRKQGSENTGTSSNQRWPSVKLNYFLQCAQRLIYEKGGKEWVGGGGGKVKNDATGAIRLSDRRRFFFKNSTISLTDNSCHRGRAWERGKKRPQV